MPRPMSETEKRYYAEQAKYDYLMIQKERAIDGLLKQEVFVRQSKAAMDEESKQRRASQGK